MPCWDERVHLPPKIKDESGCDADIESNQNNGKDECETKQICGGGGRKVKSS